MVTTVPEEVALTPMAWRLESPLIFEATPVAIEVKVSVDKTVYVSATEPPVKPASKVVIVRVSPVVLLPPIKAMALVF